MEYSKYIQKWLLLKLLIQPENGGYLFIFISHSMFSQNSSLKKEMSMCNVYAMNLLLDAHSLSLHCQHVWNEMCFP